MDTIKKDLTFIIPCHNLENFITPLLDSFLNLNTEGLNLENKFKYVSLAMISSKGLRT